LSKHAGKQQGRLRCIWKLIWQWIAKTTRRVSSSASVANRRLGKM